MEFLERELVATFNYLDDLFQSGQTWIAVTACKAFLAVLPQLRTNFEGHMADASWSENGTSGFNW